MGANLTAMPLIPRDGGTGFGSGISMDRCWARRTRRPSRPWRSRSAASRAACGAASRTRLEPADPAEGSPQNLFNRVFSRVTSDPTKAGQWRRLREQRRTVLDSVIQDFTSLEKRLGRADAQRLDAHLTAIRDIEKSLDTVGAMGAECKPIAPMSTSDFPTIGKLQMDLIVMAFACDLTRVITFMWEYAAENRTYPFIASPRAPQRLPLRQVRRRPEDHDLVQRPVRLPAGQDEQVPDVAGGTLLDHSLVFWTSEQGNGNNHSKQNMPYILAGSAGGAVKTGRTCTTRARRGTPTCWSRS
jgi:hypothetical protein